MYTLTSRGYSVLLSNFHYFIARPGKIRDIGIIVKLQVLGLGLGVDFTFTLDNNHNNNDNNDIDNNDNNPHLNFFKGTVLGVKEQGLVIRDKG